MFQVEGMAGAKTVPNSVRCAGNCKHRDPEGGRREGGTEMRLENEAEARPLRGLQTMLMVEHHPIDTGAL